MIADAANIENHPIIGNHVDAAGQPSDHVRNPALMRSNVWS